MSAFPGPLGSVRRGVVATFDEASGLGEVREADGVRRRFHCSAIVDGSRTIEVGVAVYYRLRTTVAGDLEATALASAAMLSHPERLRDEPVAG